MIRALTEADFDFASRSAVSPMDSRPRTRPSSSQTYSSSRRAAKSRFRLRALSGGFLQGILSRLHLDSIDAGDLILLPKSRFRLRALSAHPRALSRSGFT